MDCLQYRQREGCCRGLPLCPSVVDLSGDMQIDCKQAANIVALLLLLLLCAIHIPSSLHEHGMADCEKKKLTLCLRMSLCEVMFWGVGVVWWNKAANADMLLIGFYGTDRPVVTAARVLVPGVPATLFFGQWVAL